MALSGGESAPDRTARSGLRAAASPAAAVLILAGAFHFYRGVPGEGALFCAVGVALAADSAGWLPAPRPRTFRLPGRVASWALAAACGVGLAVLAPHGAAETVALTVVGVAVLFVGWVQPERSGGSDHSSGIRRSAELNGELSGSSVVIGAEMGRASPSSNGSLDRRTGGRYERTALVWCCFGVALCLVELTVYLLSEPPLREFEYPTLSTLLEPIVAQPLGRLPLLVGWLVLGLALLRWSQGGTGRALNRPSKGIVVADSSVGDVPTAVDSADLANGDSAARPDGVAPPDGAP